jgi:hypothetical protein
MIMKLCLLPQLSDEEIVARARKNIGTTRIVRVLLSCAALVIGGWSIWGFSMLFDLVIEGLKDARGQWRWFYMGFSTGLTATALLMALGWLAFYWMLTTIASFYDQRDRLLVRYHDELSAAARGRAMQP